MWKGIKKIIHQNSRFLLTTHENPDGDGIGAACALIELLKMMGKEVVFFSDSPIHSKFRFLDFHSLFKTYDPASPVIDLEVMIMVDTHQLERIGRLSAFAKNPHITTLCIDHHEPSSVLPYTSAIDPKASSSGSMVYTLFKECGYDLNKEAAMGLYASIICDTGRFSYSSTDRKAHKIAEECIKKGVDPDWMYAQLFRQVTLGEFKVFAQALKHMETFFDGKVIVQKILENDYKGLGEEVVAILHSDLDYIHDFNKQVIGVDSVVLLREMPEGIIRVSIRSNSETPVNEVTRMLGGGGHQRAAGASVRGSIQEVQDKVLALLQDAMECT